MSGNVAPLTNANIQGGALDPGATMARINGLIAGMFGVDQILWALKGANMNILTDQLFVALFPAAQYILSPGGVCVNASTSLTTAAGGIYTAAGKTGTILVAAAQVYTGADGTGPDGHALTLAKGGVGFNTAVPILNLTTGQGGAATADLYLTGKAMS